MADSNTPQPQQEGQSAAASSSTAPSSSSPPVSVLPGLDTVDWASLEHAYGEAADTPKWLQALYAAGCRSDGPANDFPICGTTHNGASYTVVDEAFAELDASITHQGSRYSASCAAVPFVYTILEAAQKKHHALRAELLTLLGMLAVGSPKFWLPSRADIVNWRASTSARQQPTWPDEEMERRDAFVEVARQQAEASGTSDAQSKFRRLEFHVELMTDPELMAATSLAELGTYDGVRQGLQSVYASLGDDYPNVRSEAAFLLALFPEHEMAAASEKVLRDQLARETVATVRGTILLTLGMLRHRPKSPATKEEEDGKREKDVYDDMHPKVEVVEDDADRAARASTRKLLEEVHAAATKRTAEATVDGADTSAPFEQWCSATALLLLAGVDDLPEKTVTDILAPLIDKKGVLSRYEPKRLAKEAMKIRASAAKKGVGERNEDKKEESFPFPDDDLASFVAPLLRQVRGSKHPDVAQAVIGSLVGAQGLSGTELFNTAFQLAFDGKRHEWQPYVQDDVKSYGETKTKTTLPKYSELTPLQQSAVSAVAQVDESCWKSADFKATVKSWGLPGDKIEIEKYMEGKEFKKDADVVDAEESPEKKQRVE
ncbi:hypothetical protein Sste5346_008496 [Sporothrix stenoceras]|uniref:Uncharacterized protein n=1 Tax=Sporothrix stenoceras TaxID=5173 RepID=A0ABR3YPZ9_9PEZI